MYPTTKADVVGPVDNNTSKPPQHEFQYEPLALDRFDIRVLSIHPGSDDDPISCTLERYVDGSGGWTCLSYTWGTETANRSIYVNGTPFAVRPNLYNFLQEARRRKMTDPLWIDSLCIYQTDHNEQSAQVALMGTIFTDAKLVIAWLGTGDDDTERALQKLDAGIPPDSTRISMAVANEVFSQVTSAECSALFRICANPFWTRQWIKQELLLPQHPAMWCGSGSVTVSVFLAAIEALADYSTTHRHQQPSAQPNKFIERPSHTEPTATPMACEYGSLHIDERAARASDALALLAVLKTWKRRNFGLDLPSMLELFKHSACTDFHDYVYAFRGLLADRKLLDVSYKLSPSDLLTRTLDFIAQTSHPRLLGSDAAQRNLLKNLYTGFRMTPSDLETLFSSATQTEFTVQCGQTLELGRKTVKAWVFAESISDPAAFAAEAWREETTCMTCHRALMQVNVSLNQLLHSDATAERGIYLSGLQADRNPNMSCLRAAYEPRWLYDCSDLTVELLHRVGELGHPVMALAFEPLEDDHGEMRDWVEEVRDEFLVTVSDSDDAGLGLLVSTMPACDNLECLLRKR